MTPEQVLVVSSTGSATIYSSIRAASRVLSGTGSDSRRRTITRRIADGGGFVGNAYVQSISSMSVRRTR